MLTVALACIVVTIVITLYRMVVGPTWGDRITALDFMSTSLAVLTVIIALRTEETAFLDVAIVISVLGFLSTVALAQFLLSGQVVE